MVKKKPKSRQHSLWTTPKDKLADDLDLNGFDPNAPDSDDEPLSDLEMWEGLQNIATVDFFFLKLCKGYL